MVNKYISFAKTESYKILETSAESREIKWIYVIFKSALSVVWFVTTQSLNVKYLNL